MKKLLVLDKYCSDCHINLDSSISDFSEQLSLNKGCRFHLTKVPKLRSEVTERCSKKN